MSRQTRQASDQRALDVDRADLGSAVAHPAVRDGAPVIDAWAGETQAKGGGHRRLGPAGVGRAVPRRVAQHGGGRAPRTAADEAQSRAGEARRREVDEVVEPSAGPAELAVALALVADHAVERVHRLVGEDARQAGERGPEHRRHHAVG